jgi:phosphopantetheinyl transferase
MMLSRQLFPSDQHHNLAAHPFVDFVRREWRGENLENSQYFYEIWCLVIFKI